MWYTQLNYNTNPFSIKPGKELIGKEEIVDSILESIKQGQLVTVTGTFGTGKTTLLRTIIKHFGGKRRVIFFSSNRLTGPLNIEQLLFKRFGFITQLLKIKSKNMILLLDEADHLSAEDIADLKNAYKKGYFKSIVFCAPKLESIKIPASIKQLFKNSTFALDTPLTNTQVVEIVRRRLNEQQLLSDDIILRIYKRDTRLRSFFKNCEVFMRHMIEQKRKTAKSSDVDRILSGNKY